MTDVIGQWGNFAYAEYNGMLYIHSGRSTNTLYDGEQHQTNMTFCVRQSDMVVTDTRLGITPLGTGYVSHSLTQDMLVDSQGRLITVDTGDAQLHGEPICSAMTNLQEAIHFIMGRERGLPLLHDLEKGDM